MTPKVEEKVSVDIPQEEEATKDISSRNETIVIKRSKRVINKPKWLINDIVVVYALLVIDNNILNTFGEALHRSESNQ